MEEYGLSEQGAGYAFGVLIAFFGIGCVIGGFLQDKQGPRFAALWGTGLLCGGFFAAAALPAEKGSCFFRGVQHPGRASAQPSSTRPSSPAPRSGIKGRKGLATGVIGGAVGLSGAFLTVFVRTALRGFGPVQGIRGRVLGAGCADPAGLPCGQCIAHRPAARKASAQPAGKG